MRLGQLEENAGGAVGNCNIALDSSRGTGSLTEQQFSSKGKAHPQHGSGASYTLIKQLTNGTLPDNRRLCTCTGHKIT